MSGRDVEAVGHDQRPAGGGDAVRSEPEQLAADSLPTDVWIHGHADETHMQVVPGSEPHLEDADHSVAGVAGQGDQ
jgi:hypothetical protein